MGMQATVCNCSGVWRCMSDGPGNSQHVGRAQTDNVSTRCTMHNSRREVLMVRMAQTRAVVVVNHPSSIRRCPSDTLPLLLLSCSCCTIMRSSAYGPSMLCARLLGSMLCGPRKHRLSANPNQGRCCLASAQVIWWSAARSCPLTHRPNGSAKTPSLKRSLRSCILGFATGIMITASCCRSLLSGAQPGHVHQPRYVCRPALASRSSQTAGEHIILASSLMP